MRGQPALWRSSQEPGTLLSYLNTGQEWCEPQTYAGLIRGSTSKFAYRPAFAKITMILGEHQAARSSLVFLDAGNSVWCSQTFMPALVSSLATGSCDIEGDPPTTEEDAFRDSFVVLGSSS